jgi:hypothetical protein
MLATNYPDVLAGIATAALTALFIVVVVGLLNEIGIHREARRPEHAGPVRPQISIRHLHPRWVPSELSAFNRPGGRIRLRGWLIRTGILAAGTFVLFDGIYRLTR